jgi:hypothetical protein
MARTLSMLLAVCLLSGISLAGESRVNGAATGTVYPGVGTVGNVNVGGLHQAF